MSKHSSPSALFDTLEEMPNPFKHPAQSIDHLLAESVENALQDFRLASEFLYSYRGSPDTFSTYRREIEHFLQWCWLIARKPVASVQREDIESYVEFAKQPPKTWIGEKNVSRFVNRNGQRETNSEWRPYVCSGGSYVCSQSAIQSLFSVLSSYFNFLIQEGHVAANPVSQIRQKSKFLRKRIHTGKIIGDTGDQDNRWFFLHHSLLRRIDFRIACR